MINTGIYRHYKGGVYVVERVVTHTESEEDMVVYCSYGTDNWWVRPLSMFEESVEYKGEVVKRFTFLGPNVGGIC